MYPLTIIKDSFDGKYSGFKYLAFNLTPDKVNSVHYNNDFALNFVFWDNYEQEIDGIIGMGETPEDSVRDLKKKINAKRVKQIKNKYRNQEYIPGRYSVIDDDLEEIKKFL